MPENGIEVQKLDDRVYRLAEELGSVKATVHRLLDDMRTLRAQLWYVVTAAILGPIAATMVQHWIWK
jgi:hypothetical protein